MTRQNWQAQKIQVDAQEVDHVFSIPLSILLNHEQINVHEYQWENVTRQYYSVIHEGYFIWGASMAILRNLDILLRAAYSLRYNMG